MLAQTGNFWTLEQLTAQVALSLSVNYAGQSNGQVSPVPDRRTIRYYTTLGLLDRPEEMRGRTAFYGRRHLLQLVAIKRLQARGLSLSEIQEHLLGMPSAALRRLAQLPAEVETAGAPEEAAAAPSRRSSAFWAATPAAVTTESEAGQGEGDGPTTDSSIIPLQGIRLDDQVTLLLEASRPVAEDETPALRAAAAPLLKLLTKRRLIRPRHHRGEPS